MTHMGVPTELKEALEMTTSMVRLSVGLEDERDLIQDLRQALETVATKRRALDSPMSQSSVTSADEWDLINETTRKLVIENRLNQAITKITKL